MGKTKSITELVIELQNENESLNGLKKGFNSMCKSEFGYSIDEIHKIIIKCDRFEKNFSSNQDIPRPVISSQTRNES